MISIIMWWGFLTSFWLARQIFILRLISVCRISPASFSLANFCCFYSSSPCEVSKLLCALFSLFEIAMHRLLLLLLPWLIKQKTAQLLIDSSNLFTIWQHFLNVPSFEEPSFLGLGKKYRSGRKFMGKSLDVWLSGYLEALLATSIRAPQK